MPKNTYLLRNSSTWSVLGTIYIYMSCLKILQKAFIGVSSEGVLLLLPNLADQLQLPSQDVELINAFEK